MCRCRKKLQFTGDKILINGMKFFWTVPGVGGCGLQGAEDNWGSKGEAI